MEALHKHMLKYCIQCVCVCCSLSLASTSICFMFLVCVCVGWKMERFSPGQTPPPDSIYISDCVCIPLSFRGVFFPAETSEWSSERWGGGEQVWGRGRKVGHTGKHTPNERSLWPPNHSLPWDGRETLRSMLELKCCIWVCVFGITGWESELCLSWLVWIKS